LRHAESQRNEYNRDLHIFIDQRSLYNGNKKKLRGEGERGRGERKR